MGPCRGRSAEAAATVRSSLASAGAEVVNIDALDAPGALEAARAAVRAGAERLIAVGGDGTVHLALQAVAGTDTVLGVVALGTANDFAHALGIDSAVTADNLLAPAVRFDAIRMGEKWVASVATAGFSGDVNARANSMGFPKGAWRYTWATILSLPRLKHRSVSLTVDGVRHDHKAVMVAVANTCSFGGAMRICPNAEPSDGMLDVTVVGDVGRLELLRCFRLVFSGRHLTHRKVFTYRGGMVELHCDDELAVWGDGEPLGFAPVRFEVVRDAVALAGAR